MKKMILIFSLILYVMLSGCSKGSDCSMERNFLKENIVTQGFSIDNAIELNQVSKEYSYDELKNFFGDYSLQEKSVFNIENNEEPLSLADVNSQFEIEFVRENCRNCYSVYKVKEGGRYYVFWIRDENNQISVSDTFYICTLKKKSDFKSLSIGKSSYEDVYSIDPASELILILSHGVYSYSLLEDKRLLEIKYEFEDLNNRSDLIIDDIKIVSSESGFSLSSILSKDLP